MKFRKLRNERGFTFLELIVVFSVMAIISTIGVVSFNDYKKTQEINGAVSDVVNILNLAKSNSRSQINPESCRTFDYTLDSYLITISSGNPSSLVLQADCIDSQVPPLHHPYGTGDNPNNPLTVTLSENVTITSIEQNSSTQDEPEIFYFPLFQGNVDGGQICISAYGGSVEKAVNVNELGIVKILNPGESGYLCP